MLSSLDNALVNGSQLRETESVKRYHETEANASQGSQSPRTSTKVYSDMKLLNSEAEVVRLRRENEILNVRLLKLEDQMRKKDEF